MVRPSGGKMQDPYKVLGLSHNATNNQIKLAYRKLAMKYHPDRQNGKTSDQRKVASDRFSAISAAYSLLADPQRKRQYDHIYKYGGFDDDASSSKTEQTSSNPADEYPFSEQAASSGTKIGFKASVYIPNFEESSMLPKFTQRTTYSGVEIPSRHSMTAMRNRQGHSGLIFSTGKTEIQPDGQCTHISKKSQTVNGKRYTRTETTVMHPDGMKEVTIEGNNTVQRSVQPAPVRKKSKESPKSPTSQDTTKPGGDSWYSGYLGGVWKKMISCNAPCGPILVQ